ncbi:uncharacterized protein [Physcomitrium patens]|nr:coiled-coil domain-containing protein 96-like isoform X2 [Physcomitrium patens]|eukprot:XP_024377245.1 coiled-coil domain-containing protein 96-like isoform X2 [Physcomitrella patens]
MAENPESLPADDTAAATPPPPPLPDPAPANPASEGDPGAVNSAEAVGLPAAASAEQPAPLKELILEEKGKLRKERFRVEKKVKERIRLEDEAELKRLRLEDERTRLKEKVEFERIQLEEERIRLEEERTRFDEEAELERIGLEAGQRKLEQEEQARMEASRLRVIIEATIEEVVGLKHENAELQRRIVNLQKRRKSVHADQFILEGQDTFYKSCLTDWAETRCEFNKIKHIYDKKIDSLRGGLQKKQYEASARFEGIIHYIYKIARFSADIISRKGIPRHVLQELELEERDTLMEMQIVRTRGRQLKCQLEKLKNTLALKDQLQLGSGNLHLVDYEQLQMENELLNEKFHLKKKALSALRKKRTQSVHLLQHIREKLHFLVTE